MMLQAYKLNLKLSAMLCEHCCVHQQPPYLKNALIVLNNT